MTRSMKRARPKSAATEPCCTLPSHHDLPLPMVMVKGWFNDQHDCFQLLLQHLSHKEQTLLFTDEALLESVKAKYKQLWDGGEFEPIGTRTRGPHKLLDQLKFSSFAWWCACVYNAAADAGSLGALLERLGTVEAAHDRFKRWFSSSKRVRVRYLNAADAARVLARCGHLRPEERPLLARGSLRGAAILLNNEPASKTINRLEEEYQSESKRVALEEKAAKYIRESEELSRQGTWMMERGESWLCEVAHKQWYPNRPSGSGRRASLTG